MPSFLTLLISILACYRLSYMLANELGPWDVFKRLRMRFSIRSNLGKGVRCALCWSLHNAGWITLYLFCVDSVSLTMAPLFLLGVTGGAVLLHKLDD